jgi:hypothetical protein
MDIDAEHGAAAPSYDDAHYDWHAKESLLRPDVDATDELVATKARADTEVFIGSISLDANESDVHAALRKCGAEEGAKDLKLMTDLATGAHRGYAFATYESAEAASKAIEAITSSACEVKNQKIRASVKPNKYRLRVAGVRRDATRVEIIEALRAGGAGLEYFSLCPSSKNPEHHNGGYGFAVYYNEACAERAMKCMQQNKELLAPLAASAEKSVTLEWAAAKPKTDTRTLCVRNMNEENNTEDALKEVFARFGDIEEVRLRGAAAYVAFVKAESAKKAIEECEADAADAGADENKSRNSRNFISSIDGSTLRISFARTVPAAERKQNDRGGAQRGKGGAQRGRDDWSGSRPAGGRYSGSSYGGGLAPRGWAGSGAPRVQNAMPVILPTGQVAYVMGGRGMGGRGGRRGGRGGGGDRHRPY